VFGQAGAVVAHDRIGSIIQEDSDGTDLHVLEAGDLIHLRGNEPHSLKATVDSSALLTLCIAKPA
jgi:hypothetical protein